MLIEFPGAWLDIEDPIATVAEAAASVEALGLVPVLAHPERCRAVADDPGSRPAARRRVAASFASTRRRSSAGTVRPPSGQRGRCSRAVSSQLAASDAHSVSRPPTLDSAYAVVRERLGDDVARPLFDGSALPWA